MIAVRATISLPGGLRPGALVLVDPERPAIAAMLEAEFLVPLPPALQPASLPSEEEEKP